MDTVHCCVFLVLIFIIFMKCSDAQHEDGITYVSTTGIDSTCCFNAGFHNPCQSFTYVLLNAHISCTIQLRIMLDRLLLDIDAIFNLKLITQ